MSEVVRSVKVEIEVDTNKTTRSRTLTPREGESYGEFAERVSEAIEDMTDVD